MGGVEPQRAAVSTIPRRAWILGGGVLQTMRQHTTTRNGITLFWFLKEPPHFKTSKRGCNNFRTTPRIVRRGVGFGGKPHHEKHLDAFRVRTAGFRNGTVSRTHRK
ncbi:hypothetical protein DQ04_10201000 [Trypanosoma grayi]|uniref:hypothetical protein n=1 Tax=Trypanosoma grayi TaxID=71804 RepID=UPI0004F3F925|nr:hypothetical protein DQ04_10201000 [Trypanosoma grayi]KEG07316.1 hypothetical protein DQ04_10201000 [Trypanosoma grayi]